MTDLHELLSDPVALAAYVQSLTLNYQRRQEHPIFAEIAAAHSSDWNLLTSLKSLVDQADTRLSAYYNLMPALAHLHTISPSELCDLLTHFRSRDEGYTWAVEGPLRTLFRGTQVGQKALLLAISNEKLLSSEAVELLADVLCQADPAAAAEFFDSIDGHTNESARTATLRASCSLLDLGAYTISSDRVEYLWELTLGAIDIDRSAYIGWEMACRLAPTDKRARSSIMAAALEGPEKAQAAIFRWLVALPPDAWPSDFAERLVELMLTSALQGNTPFQRVDSLISLLMNKSSGARPAMLVLCDVIMTRPNTEGIKLDFPGVFATLTSRGLYSVALSRYLLHRSSSVFALRELIQRGFLEPVSFVPDAAQFNDANPEARVRAIHRLLGETVHGASLCNFIYMFGVAKDLQPWGTEVFKGVFINHIAQEFPQTALDFLRERLETLALCDPAVGLIKEVIQPIQQWQGILLSLPRLAELQAADNKVLALRRHEIRGQLRMQKEVRAQSAFAQVVTSLNVTQGRRVISRSEGRPPALIELKTISQEFELPGSEVADPLAGLMRRLNYLETPDEHSANS